VDGGEREKEREREREREREKERERENPHYPRWEVRRAAEC